MIVSARELADREYSFPYLVKPVIPAGGIVFLHGKRAIGKTHFCLTLSAALSSGGVLFGRYPTQVSRTLYIQVDTPEAEQAGRVRKASLIYDMEHVYFSFPKRMSVTTLHREPELVELYQSIEPDLIIWDTLRKVIQGNTNDDDVPSSVYGAAQGLFPTATHLFVHHDKKTIVDQKELDADETFRGSGAWLDDADTGIHLSRVAPGRLAMNFTKIRTAPSQKPLGLVLHSDALTLYSPGNAESLAESWRLQHPEGTQDELYHFLLGCFVSSPNMAHKVAYRNGRPHD